ncbi:hypothetical protein GBA63_19835 [Rubrobacter tropicus]|uniref:Uncharacterized protein n=1 Tax=Rubrobacter tropicus TaxID=2653851 RepID=A0A6G8QDR9_9ACTN|nr:hypothetical protein [Rubrobacter tropicus]QIN84650.1 hypothetical protein GBA63_19835 [Rubrobacter tropicus]
MSEVQEIVRAQIPASEPTEERETEVYTAPGDMLIANVVYTPAGDIRGDWDRPRYMQLRVGRFDEPGGRYLADTSAQTSAFYLPANVPQNAELVWTNRLRVREGETLYWNSHIVRSHFADGIPDPGGTVEVLLEPANLDDANPPRLVPQYWQGKTLGIEYRLSEVPRGGGTAYHSDYVGRVVEATDRGIALEVETPQTIGVDRETYEFRYERIMHVRLL